MKATMAAWVLTVAAMVTFGVVADARSYNVGDEEGWVENGRYGDWAAKHRFHVNDWLVFRYKRGEESVLQVTKENYQRCNLTSPLRYMGSGNSVFVLDKSGSFFFVSGEKGYCQKGQKMTVVVMAERKPVPTPSPSPSSPVPTPSSPSPKSPVAPPHASPHPSSPHHSPSPSPPVKRSPVPSPSPDFTQPPSMVDQSPSPSPENQKSAGSTHSMSMVFALFATSCLLSLVV